MSDGIVEQFGPVRQDDGTVRREQFELAGVTRCLAGLKGDADPVSCIFDAVYQHGATQNLSDDATLVWVKS